MARELFKIFSGARLEFRVRSRRDIDEALRGALCRDASAVVRELPEGQTGWLAGTRDAAVGKALTLLHHRPAHPWTVAELAGEVGLSRTVLSERFRHFLGEPPMTYLTRWRLQLGARGLVATSRSVAQIAIEAGYESEASFNRAFKRHYGLPPARYRKNNVAEHARTLS